MPAVPDGKHMLPDARILESLIGAVGHDDEIPSHSNRHDIAHVEEVRSVQAPMYRATQENELANLDVMTCQHRNVGAMAVRKQIEIGIPVTANPPAKALDGVRSRIVAPPTGPVKVV